MSNSIKKSIGPFASVIPEGDDRPRMVCKDCGFIHYENPKIVTGAVCVWENKFLLCRRAIEPRKGYWTVPAGFLELGETISEGAAREVWEEACARVNIKELIGTFEIPHISQIYMVFRAKMLSAACEPGPESLEVALFKWEDIPWNEIAFPSIEWSLKCYVAGGGPVFEIYQEKAKT